MTVREKPTARIAFCAALVATAIAYEPVSATSKTNESAHLSAEELSGLGKKLQTAIDQEHQKVHRKDISDVVEKIIPRGMSVQDAEAVLAAAGLSVQFYDTVANKYHEKNPPVMIGNKGYDDGPFAHTGASIAIFTKNGRLSDGVVDHVKGLLSSTDL